MADRRRHRANTTWLAALLVLGASAGTLADNAGVRATNISVMRGAVVSQCKRHDLPQSAADTLAKLNVQLDKDAFCGCVGKRLMRDTRINGLIAGKEPALSDADLDRVLKGKAAAAGFSCMGEMIDTLIDQPAQ